MVGVRTVIVPIEKPYFICHACRKCFLMEGGQSGD